MHVVLMPFRRLPAFTKQRSSNKKPESASSTQDEKEMQEHFKNHAKTKTDSTQREANTRH